MVYLLFIIFIKNWTHTLNLKIFIFGILRNWVHHFDEFFPCLFQVWCPTPLTPCVGEWWWLPVPPSNTRVQLTVLFKLSKPKVSCPWWRELVSKIIIYYGLTKCFHLRNFLCLHTFWVFFTRWKFSLEI